MTEHRIDANLVYDLGQHAAKKALESILLVADSQPDDADLIVAIAMATIAAKFQITTNKVPRFHRIARELWSLLLEEENARWDDLVANKIDEQRSH